MAEACGLRAGDVDFMRGIVWPRVQYPAEDLKTEISRTAVPAPRSLTLITDPKTGAVVAPFGWDDRPGEGDRLADAEAWLSGKDR